MIQELRDELIWKRKENKGEIKSGEVAGDAVYFDEKISTWEMRLFLFTIRKHIEETVLNHRIMREDDIITFRIREMCETLGIKGENSVKAALLRSQTASERLEHKRVTKNAGSEVV